MSTAALLIHGFTSHRSSLEPLLPALEGAGIPYTYEMLTGHGTKPEDLTNIRWHHWQDDVEKQFAKLRANHERVVVIALSMGTVLAIELAAKHPSEIDGLVLISPCVIFYNKLSALTPVITPLIKKFPFAAKEKFSSAEFAKRDRGYPWFPTATYASYWRRTKTILDDARRVTCPVRILMSEKDHVADPRGGEALYRSLGGEKEILWHHQSGHEMFQDCEASAVIAETLSFGPLKILAKVSQ